MHTSHRIGEPGRRLLPPAIRNDAVDEVPSLFASESSYRARLGVLIEVCSSKTRPLLAPERVLLGATHGARMECLTTSTWKHATHSAIARMAQRKLFLDSAPKFRD